MRSLSSLVTPGPIKPSKAIYFWGSFDGGPKTQKNVSLQMYYKKQNDTNGFHKNRIQNPSLQMCSLSSLVAPGPHLAF